MIPALRLKQVIREQVGAIQTQCGELFAKLDIDTTKALSAEDPCYELAPEVSTAFLVVRLSQPAATVHCLPGCDEQLVRQAIDFPLQFMMIFGSHGCSSFHWFGPIRNSSREFEAKLTNGTKIKSRFIEQIIEKVLRDETEESRKAAELLEAEESDDEIFEFDQETQEEFESHSEESLSE